MPLNGFISGQTDVAGWQKYRASPPPPAQTQKSPPGDGHSAPFQHGPEPGVGAESGHLSGVP